MTTCGAPSPTRRPRPVLPGRSAAALVMAAGLLVAGARPAPGWDDERPGVKVYFDSSHAADLLLRNAENLVRAGDFAEAIEIYQRVTQQFGDKVVGVAGEPRLSINARRESQRRIAALPPEARALYRARVDPQAERWYRQGLQGRDRALLRRVVDQAFCSSWGDDALDLLGDLAFQDGQFAEALASYAQLAPEHAPGGAGLAHPDPSVDLARVAAKKLLCRAAIGEHPPTAEELAAFARAHPADSAAFAGRRGPLGADLADAVRDDHLGPPPQVDGRWPTFAGAPTRDRVAPGPIDVGSLHWRVDLDPIAAQKKQSSMMLRQGFASGVIPAPDRLLGYHPIIVGDQVLVANDHRVTAYDLNVRPGEPGSTGVVQPDVAWHTSGSPAAGPGKSLGSLPRYTLTAVGHRVYARLGAPPGPTFAFNGRNGMPATPGSPSSIVAIDRANEGKFLWERRAAEIPLPKRPNNGTSPAAAFEGTPVADARNVYVGLTDRVEMTATYVVCLDAETGETRWTRYVCEANSTIEPFSPNFEIAHRLLTLDGSTLYYQTNLGALAALDAETGGVRWLATYPWAGKPGGGFNGFGFGMGGGMGASVAAAPQQRDLNPAIVHDGLVLIAPEDTARIYAFDAATGRQAWRSDVIPDEVKLTHLLGVAKGHLIATGDRVLWFDVRTGKLAHSWPDAATNVQGFGRGLLAGDRVYWPTRTEIHVLDQATGLRADPPIRLEASYGVQGGNLAVGDGYLVVAAADSMVVFCQNSRLIERYRDEIARAPEDALNYFRLAQAAEAVGRLDLALDSLGLALPRARPLETVDGVPLAEATREHRRRLLMRLGEQAKAAANWTEAARRFEEAGRAAPEDRDRLAARLELAEVCRLSGDPRGAVRTWQALLGDEPLRALTVDATDGHRTIRADLLIADRLHALLRERGRDLYDEFDRAAADLMARARERQDPRLLEDLPRHYPAARVVPEALLALGALLDRLDRPAEAARAYKRLLAAAPDDPARARALWGLAGAFEAQKLWGPAREAYLQASACAPDLRVGAAGDPPLAGLVAGRLARAPYDRAASGPGDPGAGVPFRRRWERHWPAASKLIVADGAPPSAESARLFLAQGGAIRPLDPASGESPWARALGGEPTWVGYLADRVVAATRTRVVALGPAGGAVEWQYDLGAAAERGGPDPFAREPAGGARESDAALLGEFRIVGNRVFCLRGDNTLLALDGDTGLVDWSYSPPVGRINPRLHVGTDRVVLQVREPNGILVLDTATGRQRASFARVGDEEWPRDPLPVDDDHVAIVADRLTVALLSLRRGVPAWVFRESDELPRYGPPRLVGDGERLYVLHNGNTLIRLDPATGAKLWARPTGSDNLGDRPEAIAPGDDCVFVADSATVTSRVGTLAAIRVADGSVAWQHPLDNSLAGWSVALAGRSVAAYPNQPRARGAGGASFPLVFRRRDDGQLLQRFQFPASPSDLAVRFSPKGALVVTSTAAWSLGDRQGMDGAGSAR